MKFTKQFLIDSRDDSDATVYEKIIDVSRWTIMYERVFKHEGKFYMTEYSVGATEQQDELPYEYANDGIECDEVYPVEKTVTVYEKVLDKAPGV